VSYLRLIFNTMTLLPGAQRLPLIRSTLRKRVTGTGVTPSARYCYAVWLRHLVMAAQHGLDTDPGQVAELGPGDSIGVGLAALLCGAQRYSAFDMVAHTNLERNIGIFDELVALLRRREDVPGSDEFPNMRPYLQGYRFPSHVLDEQRMDKALAPDRVFAIRQTLLGSDSEQRIRYCVPWSDRSVLSPKSQDVVFSQAVLEHIDRLPEAYQAMRSWLKPGGFVSHQIDLKSHGWAATWDGHWRYGDLHWKILRGRDSWFINRQPLSRHLSLLEEAGFQVIHTQLARSAPSYERSALARRFSSMSDEDRETSGAYVLAALRPTCLA
jgi:hypothetical protein